MDGYTHFGLARDGGFAEYCTVPEHYVYKLPDEMSFEEGAFS